MEDRYARQRIVAGVGPGGQARLAAAKVLIVGLGGLGCPAATNLVGAGVGQAAAGGHVTLVDPDVVAPSNLHRQPLYAAGDVGQAKLDVATRRLAALNPDVRLRGESVLATAENARRLVAGHDVVLDCTDDLAARYALSDACAAARVPLVQAGLGALDGQVAVLCGPAADAPCYRCLHPDAQQGATCAQEGTLGPLASAVGSLQALRAMQTILGWPEGAAGRLVVLDGRTGEAHTVLLKRRQGCKAHVQSTTDGHGHHLGGEATDGPACPMPWNAPQTLDIAVHEFAPVRGDYFVLDVREPDEFEEVHIDGAHLVPMGQLTQRLVELPKDRPIAVVCAVGGRSARATAYLRQHGYNATNLRGGMRAWMMAGLPA